MSDFNIKAIVRFGLEHERMRMEIATHNLAMSNVAMPKDSASPLKSVRVSNAFSTLSGPQASVEALDFDGTPTTKKIHDPTHPLADSDGMVLYPNVDPAREMTVLVSATRAYEANVRAYNTLRNMSLKGLEIGSKQ